MMYLRFGEVPKNRKSINFLKMSIKQQEDFTFFCENGDMEEAYACVPESAYEAGLSVFEMNAEKMPVISNLQLVTSLLSRIDDVIYEVSGEEIGKGNDGEPLINNVKIEKTVQIDKEKILNYVLTVLVSSFKCVRFDKTKNNKENKINSFFAEYKINKKTGEKISIWEKTEGADWINIPPYTEYTFNGWSFSDPVDGFEADLGIKRS